MCVLGTAPRLLGLGQPSYTGFLGCRGASTGCWADPEIAVPFRAQPGGAQGREPYVHPATSSQGGGTVILDAASQGRVTALSRGSCRLL